MNTEHQDSKRNPIMTLKEVAKYLGVHDITIYRLIKETNIPAIKLRGQWRFKKDVLDAWLTSRMEERNNECSETIHDTTDVLQNETLKTKKQIKE